MITKTININSTKDLDNFYRKLKIYKSIFYTFVKFQSDNFKIKKEINALNIKNRRKRINYIYDNSCLEIDNYWKDKNPCCFKNNKCTSQQKDGCKYKNGCCRRCVYQSNNGCTTSNLTCKLFYCTCVSEIYDILKFKNLKMAKLFSIRQKIILKHDYFSSREEVINDLYIGSIIIFIIRLLIRYVTKNIVSNQN